MQRQIDDHDHCGQGDRDLKQEDGEPPQTRLELGFRLTLTESHCDATEFGVDPGGDDHPGTRPGVHDGPHERAVRPVRQGA